MDILFFILGLAGLYYGAEWLVRGASSIAAKFGISSIVIGLTVVAFGTSAPELIVSVIASWHGKGMIAVSNVVGSNICNIGLVLGLSATILPIACDPSIVKRELPIMIAASFFVCIVLLDAHVSRLEGLVLFSAIVVYTVLTCRIAVRQCRDAAGATAPAQDQCTDDFQIDEQASGLSNTRLLLYVIAGIAGILVGAECLVKSAVSIMKALGVDEKFIGLTVVAFGTSLPELATSVVAALKKEMDLSVGNLVGSNLFNLLSVLGAAAVLHPIRMSKGFADSGMVVDYAVMLLLSILPFFMMRKKALMTRKYGIVLLSCYGMYIGYLAAEIIS